MYDNEIFRFDRGAFFGGTIIVLIYEMPDDENHVEVHVRLLNGFCERMKSKQFLMQKKELEKIKSFLEGILDWKTEYKDEQTAGILDGYGWEIEYDYNNFSFSSQGYECYPPDYQENISGLQEIIEDLCAGYDSDHYDVQNRIERINL